METYRDPEDCAAKVEALLSNEARRSSIADAGQRRTLRNHTVAQRVSTLFEMLRDLLK